MFARGGIGDAYGSALGGSGSGGRIAVHVLTKDEYRGGLEALGGQALGPRHGGSGTVYVEEIRGKALYTRLYINNQKADPPKAFVLHERNPKTVQRNATEKNSADFGFDELMLQGQVLMYFFVLGMVMLCGSLELAGYIAVWIHVEFTP